MGGGIFLLSFSEVIMQEHFFFTNLERGNDWLEIHVPFLAFVFKLIAALVILSFLFPVVILGIIVKPR